MKLLKFGRRTGSRSSKALANLITSFMSQLASVVINIITLQIFLETFGSEMNGLISTIMQILIYMKILEAGIGMASIQALYKPLSQKSWQEVNEILSATKLFYKKAGYYFLIITLILAMVFPYISDSEIKSRDVGLLILIMSIPSIIEFFVQGKIRVLITADQKLYIINIFYSISLISAGLIRIILLNCDFDVIFVQMAHSLTSIVNVLLLSLYLKRSYDKVSYNADPNKEALAKKSSALVHQISGLVVNGAPILIISVYFGFTLVSIYSVYNLIFSTVTNFMWMFSHSVTPGFGELLQEKNKEKLNSAYSNFESIFYVILSVVYSTLAVVAIPFIALFTKDIGDAEYIDFILLYLFVAVNFSITLRIPANNLINASGHFHNTKKQALIEACLNVGLSLIFIHYIGIYGVLIGGLLSYLYRAIDIIRYNNKFIIKGLLTKTLVRIFTNVLTSIFLILLFSEINLAITNWYDFVLFSLVSFILITIVLIIINILIDYKIMKNNFNRIVNILKNIFLN